MCNRSVGLAVLVLVMTGAGVTRAELFTPALANPSFELPSLGAGNGGQWADHADAWILNAQGWAYLEDGSWFPAPDGINVLKMWSGATLWQQVGTWDQNTTYEISMWVGRSDTSSGVHVRLWAGGNASLRPSSGFGEIDATVGATLIGGGDLTPSVAVGENEWMTLTLNTGTGFKWGDPLWLSIQSMSATDTATYVDGVAILSPLERCLASRPEPANNAVDVWRDASLTWTAGLYAERHDVYLGTMLADVNAADRADPRGVLVSQGQDAATYDPANLFAFGRTYYWRVDEVNAPPTESTSFRGRIWSFTTEPYGYPIKPVKATASSVLGSTMGPEKTIDGSGLDASDQHSSSSSQMWLSKKGQSPIWIQYEFDKVYKLHQMWVWNSNQLIEPDAGFGAKDVTIETSTDGTTWTALADVPQFNQATGEPNYVHNTTVDFRGVQAKFVKLTISLNWVDGTKQAGLSEIRFFYVPVKAFAPTPAAGASGVAVGAVLNWRPGREAAKHEVFLGTDPGAMTTGAASVATVAEHRLPLGPLGLEYGKTYYWKVNEVNDAAAPKSWDGDLWSFTTPDFGVVDDFESYNDTCDRIFFAWADGMGHNGSSACGTTPRAGNGTGSTVGNANAPFAERTLVHGGRQSMPFAYDNTAGKDTSEAVRSFDAPQDWTAGGAKTLVLHFRGSVDNGPGQLYLNINGVKVVYSSTADALTRSLWKQWNVDLASVATSLEAVRTLAIGVSGTGKGVLYVDDILLYRAAPPVAAPADPGTTGLTAYYGFNADVKDSSGHGLHGTAVGDPTYVEGMVGYGKALQFEGIDDYVDLPIGGVLSTLTSSTFALWINTSSAGGSWQRILDFGTGTTAYMFLCPHTTATGPMRFAITTSSSAGESIVNAPTALPVGWHHVAVVIDGQAKTAQLCLDGDVVASGQTATLPSALGKTTQNWLGRSQYAADAFFSGVLDEFRIYSRALSQGEVRYLAGDR